MGKLARFWKDFQSNWDTYLIIIGSITVGVVAFVLSTLGQKNVTAVLSLTLTILALVAISIRRDRQIDLKTEHSIQETHGMISSLVKNKAFEQQCDAYRFLIDVIKQDGAKEAVFLQYSSKTCLDVVRVLVKRGAKVTIYIQHEDTAASIGSQAQVRRIVDTTEGLRGDLGANLLRLDKLKVYKYRTPGSVSGIRIDNRVLCMGWYTYESVAQTISRVSASDSVEVSGHDVAALVVWKGTSEFEALNKTFSKLEENYRGNSEVVQV